ncbi:hypothetical protein DMENIID0001_059320 [Sergentomyia squamirostris]
MGKKGTKKKTKWQTLPIDNGTNGGAVTKDEPHGNFRDRQVAADKPFSAWRLQTSASHSVSSQTSSLSNVGDKTPASHSESFTNGHHGQLSYQASRSQHQHRRRNAHQHNSGRQPYYGRNYYGDRNSGDNRPTFNEDEYTRITTPRQDVLFKKGYLSRPKKYNNIACSSSVNDSNTPSTSTSGSGAVSVTSIEDSTTPSTQSVSPEHCNSMSETSDGDYPYMYPGFFDQNGVFYGYPFMPSNPGFDPYQNGQMMFMPYPVEFYNPSMMPYEQPSEDSQTIPPQSETPSSVEDQAVDEKETAETEEDAQKTIDEEIVEQEVPFIPPMFPPPQPAFYFPPYVFAPPPILPVYEDPSLYEKPPEEPEQQEEQQEEQDNGVTEKIQKPEDDQNEPQASNDELKDNVILNDPAKIALKSTLNVEVQEFHPRCTNIPQLKVNNQDVPKKEQPVKKKQPYSQIITSRKLLQEATKSIQEQNIDLLKNNPLATNTTTAVAADVKWHTVVKPTRGRKGKSIAVDQCGDSDDENHEESVEIKQPELVANIVEASATSGKSLSKKKVPKTKKKSVKKTNRKQSTGFEVIEPDFGQVRINRKTDNAAQPESESEDVDDSDTTTIDATTDTIQQENEDKDAKVIDLCDEAECRMLEVELQYIESILNLGEVSEENNVPNKVLVEEPVLEEKIQEDPINDSGEVDPTSELKELIVVEQVPDSKPSLLEAVTQWLDEQNKNTSAECLLRLPDNPAILQRFYESAFPQDNDMMYGDDATSESESDEEDTDTCVDDTASSKEPLKHQPSLSEDDYIDTDSDYQSDNQQKNKRITSISSCSSDHQSPLTDTNVDRVDENCGSPEVDCKSSSNNNNVHQSQTTPLLHACSSTTTTYSKSPVLCILM